MSVTPNRGKKSDVTKEEEEEVEHRVRVRGEEHRVRVRGEEHRVRVRGGGTLGEGKRRRNTG